MSRASRLYAELLPLLDSPSSDAVREREVRSGCRVWSFCPVHPDGTKYGRRSMSLHATYGLDCFAGCTFRDIVLALQARTGLHPMRPKLTSRPPKGSRTSGHYALGGVVATWAYEDEMRQPILRVVRLEGEAGKTYLQQHPNGTGPCCPSQQCKAAGDDGWRWGRGDARYVLYRLPELTAADPEAIVGIGEGESCADVLAQNGLIATTSSGGAGKWNGHDYAAALEGRRIVIFPDNDPPGAAHAEDIISDLLGVAAEVRCVILPGLPFKGDVRDWMQGSGTREALVELVEAAPVLRSPSVMFPRGIDTRALSVAGAGVGAGRC